MLRALCAGLKLLLLAAFPLPPAACRVTPINSASPSAATTAVPTPACPTLLQLWGALALLHL